MWIVGTDVVRQICGVNYFLIIVLLRCLIAAMQPCVPFNSDAGGACHARAWQSGPHVVVGGAACLDAWSASR